MENKLNIYIIRHGEKIGGEKGLTKKGMAQVGSLTKRLGKLKITNIYSSDLLRCRETSDIIKRTLKLHVKYEKALREVPSIIKENPKKHKKEIKIIKDFWNKLDKANGNILLVSSGIVNRILISFSLNINSSNANFMQYQTGLTRMEKVKKKKYRIWYINDTSHLSNKLKIVQQE
ncbi:hypothetical protein COU59_00935 [Candidatus Pacearchaeota archaeon CG10_big_fil_rev_8_21_14_0_10_34_12]|nr:MAG: hypothetical protein COU59_00935 [Candidatus Pacearchaeota archaeon CG10_big_fil_rev_8_21_14_0_10_34_12]